MSEERPRQEPEPTSAAALQGDMARLMVILLAACAAMALFVGAIIWIMAPSGPTPAERAIGDAIREAEFADKSSRTELEAALRGLDIAIQKHGARHPELATRARLVQTDIAQALRALEGADLSAPALPAPEPEPKE